MSYPSFQGSGICWFGFYTEFDMKLHNFMDMQRNSMKEIHLFEPFPNPYDVVLLRQQTWKKSMNACKWTLTFILKKQNM